MKKRLAAMIILLAFSLVLTSCTKKADYVDDGISNIDFSNGGNSDEDSAASSDRYGSYTYPDNPVEELRSYLESDAKQRGLPLEIGNTERVAGGWQDTLEFSILFTNDNNACVVSFATKSESANDDYYSLDGKDNPSFTLAFKDPDNSEDMITVLTSVIKYISPDLSLDEAKELAVNQDETISIDGYSMPQDIGGYQVQARYTNPHVFVSTREFEAKLGVQITALKQIWGELDASECQELKNLQDYRVLTSEYSPWEDDYQKKTVYADFIVKDVWQHEEWVHGDSWETVDVESMSGEKYTLRVETMRMRMGYEFGVGQRYTLYIFVGSYYGAEIIYAVQRSTLKQYTSRGIAQPLSYSNEDWDNRIIRIEPEGDGQIYDVCFSVGQYFLGESYAALEGHGIGEKQWPSDPGRDGYTFAGWYDNEEGTGSPYSPNTPINHDTNLYAKWKYSGSGGIWPRAHRGDIQGIDDGSVLSAGQKAIITADGYNMNLSSPEDQRFRWIPLRFRISDSIGGDFTAEAPCSAEFSIAEQGAYTLYITYFEEIFDGMNWQETGQIREAPEVSFQIKN